MNRQKYDAYLSSVPTMINKKEFLSTNELFIDWFSVCCDSRLKDETLHSWISRSVKAQSKKGQEWRCSNLWEGFQKYYWKTTNPFNGKQITSFQDSEDCLLQLQYMLLESLNKEDSVKLAESIEKVLIWGGVNQRPKIASDLRSLYQDGDALLAYVTDAIKYLTENMASIDSCSPFRNDFPVLQVDSGTTKVFSLLVENFIIYDSRVGAALGILVAKWLSNTNFECVPNDLLFSWSPGSVSTPRDPNIFLLEKTNRFPRISNNVERIAINIKASWICEEAINRLDDKSGFKALTRSQAIRALEASLFMLGYATS